MFRKTLLLGLSAAWLFGCAGTPPEDEPLGAMEIALAQNPDFAGHSVKICGDRYQDADPIYPCDNHPGCECFDFAADGTLVAPAVFEGLCPSDNHPPAPWTFTYTLYDQPSCPTGHVISAPPGPTAPDFNLVCYDVRDLAARDHENQSVEELARGANLNQVICLTRDANKDWDFEVCLDETTTADATLGLQRLDCGCEPLVTTTTTACLSDPCPPPPPPACGCDRIDLTTLAADCAPRPEEGCDIVCAPNAEAMAGVRYRAFKPLPDGEELWLGEGDLTDPNLRVGRQFQWDFLIAEHDFEFRYDPNHPAGPTIASYVDDEPPLEYLLPAPFVGLNSVSVRAKSLHPFAYVNVHGLQIEGVGHPDISAFQGADTDTYWAQTLDDGFHITGRLQLLGVFLSGNEDTSLVEILVGHNLLYLP